MATKRKFPKAPKSGASKERLEKWEKDCKVVAAHNGKIDADRRAKQAVRDRVAKLKAK